MLISIQEANAAIGSMDSAYFGILIKGQYMPKRRSSIITKEYLFKIMTNQVFRIKQSEVKIGQLFQKVTTLKLLEYLQTINTEKPWGFDDQHLPDKVWMTNVLYSLKSNHPIFTSYMTECKSALTLEDIRIIQSFNTSLGRSSQGRFFKRSKEQQSAYKIQKNEIQKQKKQQKIDEKANKNNSLEVTDQYSRELSNLGGNATMINDVQFEVFLHTIIFMKYCAIETLNQQFLYDINSIRVLLLILVFQFFLCEQFNTDNNQKKT